MRERHWVGFACFLLAASLLLASCGSDDDKAKDDTKIDDKTAAPKEAKKPPSPAPICPQVAVVRGLDVIRNAENESHDPADLISGAKLVGVEGDCEYLDEGGIDITFNLDMVAKRGPKLDGMHTSFPLFVAVLDPQGNILNKNLFKADVSFSSEKEYMNHSESLHVTIPLPKDQKITGPYYRVLGGFQLTPEQEADMQKAATPAKPN